jgi:hypothetical protein
MQKVIAMGTGQKWMGIILMLATLLLACGVPWHAWRGGDRFRGAHPHHGFRGPRVFIRPRLVVPFRPYWAPYAYSYVYPPVVVQPPPPIYVQPPPQPYWYYCDDPPGYYPHVPQCLGGWRQVAPGPQ